MTRVTVDYHSLHMMLKLVQPLELDADQWDAFCNCLYAMMDVREQQHGAPVRIVIKEISTGQPFRKCRSPEEQAAWTGYCAAVERDAAMIGWAFEVDPVEIIADFRNGASGTSLGGLRHKADLGLREIGRIGLRVLSVEIRDEQPAPMA